MLTFDIIHINSEFHWRLKSANGQIILNSEAYITLTSCENSLSHAHDRVKQQHSFQRSRSSNGNYYFTLTAVNGIILAKSESYASEKTRDEIIDTIITTFKDQDFVEAAPASFNLIEFIKDRRKKARLTQDDLAEKAGVGIRFIRDLEQGKDTLRLDKVNQVLSLFGHEMQPVPSKKDLE
ncbi:MAG: type II toxin-antitoxin system Y4mF family antitoxin [Pseudobacter sp.]|uniref:type II toxin-antitoxin system Y4mF family antitoxin n=1 Tax=Pseudobacter sp. TaxID=2045420 RepID=UPI003F7F7ADF